MMIDVALIWDRRMLFEKLFLEYEVTCERVSPMAVGTPYSPKYKVAIIPVGFGNPAYSSVAKVIKSLRTPLKNFVTDGGIVIVFSPFIDNYDFKWLDLPYGFKMILREDPVKIEQVKEHPAAHIVDILEARTDGYFTDVAEEDVILKSEDGAVLTLIPMGDGFFVLTTIHELPSRRFITWALETSEVR
jgi:hypothetical protein